MEDLTSDELDFVMKYETARKKTFMAKWPHEKIQNLSGAKMAEAGFYFIGKLTITFDIIYIMELKIN